MCEKKLFSFQQKLHDFDQRKTTSKVLTEATPGNCMDIELLTFQYFSWNATR